MKDVLLRKASGFDFYNTSKYTFEKLMDDLDHIEENFRDYLNGFSENVQDIIQKFEFDGHITRMANKNILYIVLKEFTTEKANLHPDEIPFTRYFYKYEAPRPSEEIMAEIMELEKELSGSLEEVFC
ncbi:HsdM N-terminal domain-containing protein [Lachnobacterium bovis]|nr:HsdM N-terminal domain-containing protein [Lachnobacterium bovis]